MNTDQQEKQLKKVVLELSSFFIASHAVPSLIRVLVSLFLWDAGDADARVMDAELLIDPDQHRR